MRARAGQGLTLIEVLVAVALFAVVSSAVLSMFPGVVRLNGQTRADQSVTIGAKGFMEAVRVNYSTRAGFDAGTLPAAPAGSAVNSYTCTAAVGSELSSTGTTAAVLVKRVTLSCTRGGEPTYTFALDLGRPPS